ncbi:four helix bundle protein [Candidatus Saccharibacteria bacterium]|nr:four helix bundle protein [Candidatus Saccharibacteria bacterium]
MHRAVELEKDLIQFSVSVITFLKKVEKDIPRSLADQLIRSATSVGANYTEAINGSSKADFKNKIYIAKKEASETKYWLNIIKELCQPENVDELLDEIQKYIMILQKTVNTLNGKTKHEK